MKSKEFIVNLTSDRPIQTFPEDLLDRGRFAISISNAISQWSNSEGLVLAIYGPWGHGKTSIKNLVIFLLSQKANGPTVIEFNPWNWSGENRILSSFFDEIGAALPVQGHLPSPNTLSTQWKAYSAHLMLGGTVLDQLRRVSEFTGVPWAPFILEALSVAARSAGEIGKDIPGATVHESATTLENLKHQLCRALETISAPILIVIDDIDRLTKEEIRTLFRIIKINADFPKIIYLLLFDREIVEQALADVSGTSGRVYMEKIIQAGFDLPRVRQSEIDKAVFRGLDSLLGPRHLDSKFDFERWQKLYLDGLQPFFRSLRDVNRFLSAFSFELGMLHEDGVIDVNLVDLIGIETLRVFEPNAYQGIYDSREDVISVPLGGQRDRRERSRIAATISSIIDYAEDSRKLAVKHLVSELFPKAKWALASESYELTIRESWDKEMRVCHYNTFDRYFVMGLASDEVSNASLKWIMSLDSQTQLVEEFTRLDKSGRLDSVMGRLYLFRDELSDIPKIKPFIASLFEIEQLVPFAPDDLFGVGLRMTITRLISFRLQRVAEVADRTSLIRDCIEEGSALWLPIEFLSHAIAGNKNESSLFDCDGIETLKNACLRKIERTDLAGIEGLKLQCCLWRWREWDDNAKSADWCKRVSKDVAGALRLLRAFTTTTYSSHGSGTQESQSIALGEISWFIDIEILKSVLNEIIEGGRWESEDLRAEFEATVEIFKRSLIESDSI